LAEAFIIGADFIGSDRVALALGDNIFFGHGLTDILRQAACRDEGATIFAYQVRDPQCYGVVSFDPSGRAVSIVEKPEPPRSNWAITGIYFYDNAVVELSRRVKPSLRGELEISDINRMYLEAGRLTVERLGRGFAWLDTGTFESLLSASSFIQALELRQGVKVACLEEISYRMGFIDRDQLLREAAKLQKSGYGDYLLAIAEENQAERE
jgi:glucose-1-phosphate thymidylyltransferase